MGRALHDRQSLVSGRSQDCHEAALLWSLTAREVQVLKSCFAIALLIFISASSAFAQYVAVVQACSRDVASRCSPSRPGGDRLIECIKTHFADFTRPCQAALVRVAAVRESCAADIEAQCPAVKPSAGRILLCVKQRFATLSERCRDAIGHAAERK
jgi:hypothetical protein